MTHAHDHEATSAYYLDQICSIAACGALGGVAVMMWYQGRLGYILNPKFFTPVLIGGVALIVLTLIRAVALWREAGNRPSCCDGHSAGGDAHGAHVHHAHEHEHDHDHAWTPAKYAVLLLPVALFLLNLPNSSFSDDWKAKALGNLELESPANAVAAKGGKVLELGFRELSNAAFLPETRTYFEGRSGRLVGQFKQVRDKEFTLFRIKITCCAADAVPLQVRIIAPDPVGQFKMNDWVSVEGQIQFHKVAGAEKYLPVLVMESNDGIKPTTSRPSDFDI